MADWFTIVVCILIGFLLGRLFPLFMKFKKFIEKEGENNAK